MRSSNEGRILLVLIGHVLLFASSDSELILAEKARERRQSEEHYEPGKSITTK